MTAYATPTAWYTHYGDGSTTGYYAVTKRPQNSSVSAGALVRQFTAPSVGSERVFACVVAGTTANTTDATWTVTKGAKTTDGTATWIEVTGQPAVNGDTSSGHCPVWGASLTPTLGVIIYDSGTSSLQVCTTSGAGGTGSAPTFSGTAGVTTSDASAIWTSLGSAPVRAWSAPHARLANALAWGAAGNDFYVADNNAETASSTISLVTGTGTVRRVGIMSVDHTASVPPNAAALKAGASSSPATPARPHAYQNAAFGSTHAYYYGLTFQPPDGQSTASASCTGSQSALVGQFRHLHVKFTRRLWHRGASETAARTTRIAPM